MPREPATTPQIAGYFQDGRRLFTAQGDRKLTIWQPPSNRFSTIECASPILAATCGGRNGEGLVIATDDRKIRFHPLPEGRASYGTIDLEWEVPEHLAMKGIWLAVATNAGLRAYNTANPNDSKRIALSGPARLPLTAMAFAPEGPIIAGLTTKRQLDTWDLSKNTLTSRVNLPADELLGLAFGPQSGQAVVFGRRAGRLEYYLFEQIGRSEFRTVNGPDDATAIATLGIGNGIAFAGKNRLGVFDPTVEPISIRAVARLPNFAVRMFSVSRDGRRVLCRLAEGISFTLDADAPAFSGTERESDKQNGP